MIAGSLFSGIGGGDLGALEAGMEIAWQIEIDEACQDVLSRHHPNVKRFRDVRECGSNNLAPVDVLIGGFPCQDLSVAGKRAGLAGERSGLWFEFHRILSELEPSWVVIENVPGLLSSNKGRDFAVILRGLVELGYGVCWRVLDAQYFGLAQRRNRVFIVGHLGDGRAAEVLFESEGLRGDTPPGRTQGKSIAAPLTRGSASGSGVNAPGRRREDDVNLVISGTLGAAAGKNRNSGQANEADMLVLSAIDMALNAHGGSGRLDAESETFVVSPPPRSEGHDAGEDGSGRRTLVTAPLTTNYHADNESHESKLVVSTPLGSHREGGQRNDLDNSTFVPCGLQTANSNMQGPIYKEGLAWTVEPHPSQTRHAVAGAFGVRRLTPTECERLQGFPDGWTDGQSDSARYRQLGNAWAVPVAAWIMKRIVAVEEAE